MRIHTTYYYAYYAYFAIQVLLLNFLVDVSVSAEFYTYQRYTDYPPYCSDIPEMATRNIPPLPTNKNNNENTRIVHVSAIIRHGARTPVHTKHCFDGHWDNEDGIWDCQLTTLLSTRPYYEGQSNDDDKGAFLVEKIYDAFQGDEAPYRNRMNGTCQDGQLIKQGYDQHISNGKHLRNAYVYDGSTRGSSSNSSQQADPRLRLFVTSSLHNNNNNNNNNDKEDDNVDDGDYPFLNGKLRYRSDDDQRTLASGQVLLSTMFGPELLHYNKAHNGVNPIITHHTADRSVDILSSVKGKFMCPTQKAAISRSDESEEYQAFIKSDENVLMRQLIKDELLRGADVNFGGIDCLMTSICTDRSLPDVINDYKLKSEEVDDNQYTKKYGRNRFERLMNYIIVNKTMANRYNDSELSKMDMGPFWNEIVDYIKPVIKEKKNNDNNGETDYVKFALYSGHDSTIAPLMASLSPKIWNNTNFPWYASMMIIEIHEVIDEGIEGKSSNSNDASSRYSFRLVYNGQVLTWLIEGCPEYSHLCDVSILMNRVTQFATREHRGCGIEDDIIDSPGRSSFWSISEQYAMDYGIMFWLISMSISFIIGSILTCSIIYICRCCNPRKRQRDQSELVSSGRDSSVEFTMNEPDVVID